MNKDHFKSQEMREDFYLCKLAESTDNPDQKFFSHDEAWK
jgi:hypothetical protein